VESHVIRAGKKLSQVSRLDTEVRDSLRREIRVRHQNNHPERLRPVHYFRADPASPDHAERLAAQLSTPDRGSLPPALVHGSIRGRDPASGRQQQTEGQLGGGTSIPGRGVENGHTSPGGCGEIDVVGPHAGSADDFEPVRRLDQRPIDQRTAADKEACRARHSLLELVPRQIRQVLDHDPG